MGSCRESWLFCCTKCGCVIKSFTANNIIYCSNQLSPPRNGCNLIPSNELLSSCLREGGSIQGSRKQHWHLLMLQISPLHQRPCCCKILKGWSEQSHTPAMCKANIKDHFYKNSKMTPRKCHPKCHLLSMMEIKAPMFDINDGSNPTSTADNLKTKVEASPKN